MNRGEHPVDLDAIVLDLLTSWKDEDRAGKLDGRTMRGEIIANGVEEVGMGALYPAVDDHHHAARRLGVGARGEVAQQRVRGRENTGRSQMSGSLNATTRSMNNFRMVIA